MTRSRCRLRAAAAVALAAGGGLLLAPARPAHAAPDSAGARALGLGEALRAAATGTAAELLNPAGLALIHAYIPEVDFAYLPEQKGHTETASLSDSLTSRVAAGLYYQHFSFQFPLSTPGPTGPLPLTAQSAGYEFGGALAVPLADALLLGETTKYVSETTQIPGSLDEHRGVVTEDVGLDVKVNDVASIAAVGQNLVNPTRVDPRTYAGGLAFLPAPAVLFDADAAYDTTSGPGTRQKYMGGGEYFAGGRYPVRAGFAWDVARHATYGSLGLGVTTPQVALDVAVQQELSGGREIVLAASLRLFLNGAQ